MLITNYNLSPSLSRTLGKSTTYMSKEIGRIYSNFNMGDRKVRTWYIHDVDIVRAGRSGSSEGSGGCGVRGHGRIRGLVYGTRSIDISKHVDFTKTYVQQEVLSQLGITSEG